MSIHWPLLVSKLALFVGGLFALIGCATVPQERVLTPPTPLPALDCTQIQHLDPTSPEAVPILEALLNALPARQAPDLQARAPFAYDQVRSVSCGGDWVIVQTSFKQYLDPGIFLLQRVPDGYQYTGHGWFGPAQNSDEIRRSLAQQAPGAPAELFTTFEPAEWFVR
jgi:hypothetical protein